MDQVWTCSDEWKQVNRILDKTRKLGILCMLLPFLCMLLSGLLQGVRALKDVGIWFYNVSYALSLPLFLVSLICYILWIIGSIRLCNAYNPEEALRWCPVTKDGLLFLYDLTNPEFLEELEERPIQEENMLTRLDHLQDKLAEEETRNLLLSMDMLEQFGIHVLGITEKKNGILGTKCVCWFGRNEQGEDISHSFYFYSKAKEKVAFREALDRVYQNSI